MTTPPSDLRKVHMLLTYILSEFDRVCGQIGVDYALNQCRTVMDAGAPGLHFFTFNEHAAVLDVLDQLDLPRYSNRFSQPLSELEFA